MFKKSTREFELIHLRTLLEEKERKKSDTVSNTKDENRLKKGRNELRKTKKEFASIHLLYIPQRAWKKITVK